MEYLIVFIITFINSASISIKMNRKIEEVLPIVVIGIILVIYILGLFNNLALGVNIVELITTISLIHIIMQIKNKKQKIIRNIITPGIVIYLMYIMINIILNKGRILEKYDSFNHWALITKNMYLYNGYGMMEKSIVNFNEYPPFTAIFQYLFLKIKGEYAEDTIIIAQNILYFSMIMPLFRNIDWQGKIKNLNLLIPTVIFIPMIFYKDFYTEILVDGFIGILFALGLYTIYKKENDQRYRYIMIGSYSIALALIKNTGIVFASTILIVETISLLKEKDKLRGILIISILVLLIIGSWWAKILINKGNLNWKDKESIYIKEGQEESRNEVIHHFANEIIEPTRPITVRNLSLLMCFTIYITYSIFLYKKIKAYRLKSILITMIMTTVLYVMNMLVVYLTLFEQEETQILSSFNRYASTMLLSGFFLNTIILCDIIEFKTYYLSLIVTLLLFFLPIEDISSMYIHAREYNVAVMARRNEYGKIKKYKNLFNETDKIYLVTDRLSDYKFAMAISKYELMPILIGNDDGTDFNKNLKDELMDNYTYIYILKENNQFNKIFESTFGEKIEFESDSLYKINKKNDNIEVEKILLNDIFELMVFE